MKFGSVSPASHSTSAYLFLFQRSTCRSLGSSQRTTNLRSRKWLCKCPTAAAGQFVVRMSQVIRSSRSMKVDRHRDISMWSAEAKECSETKDEGTCSGQCINTLTFTPEIWDSGVWARKPDFNAFNVTACRFATWWTWLRMITSLSRWENLYCPTTYRKLW